MLSTSTVVELTSEQLEEMINLGTELTRIHPSCDALTRLSLMHTAQERGIGLIERY